MNQTPLSARLRRGAALGLGVALLSGAALAAAAPAHAAPAPVPPVADSDATHIAESDIGTEYGALGWQTFSLDNINDVGGALELYYGATITNNLEAPETLASYSEAIADELISWTTTEDTTPSTFEFTVKSELNSTATVRYTDAVSGTNTPGAGSNWSTYNTDLTGITANTATAFETIVAALETAGYTEVTSYGINSVQSASHLTSLVVPGAEFTFGGPPSIPLDGITTTIAGSPAVGQTLTLTTSGWPAGTELSYEWFWNGGNMGSSIEGASGTSYTITGDVLTRAIGVIVTGTLEGFSPTASYGALTERVTAPELPAAPAPAADSSELPAFLAANAPDGVQAQDAAGLPAGSLNAGSSHTATVTWAANDSFVDVYAFSTPTLVGTFAVVDGVVQVELTTGLLSQLSAGDHTLVVVGQSSKAAQAYALNVTAGLAETGVETALPIGAAALMLLLGAAALIARRRQSAQL